MIGLSKREISCDMPADCKWKSGGFSAMCVCVYVACGSTSNAGTFLQSQQLKTTTIYR